jgi:hypothetical protein
MWLANSRSDVVKQLDATTHEANRTRWCGRVVLVVAALALGCSEGASSGAGTSSPPEANASTSGAGGGGGGHLGPEGGGGASIEDIEAGIAARRAELIAWSALIPETAAPKYRPYDILALTALHGCGPPEWAAYMASLGSIDLQEDDNLFALPPLVRYLNLYGACMSDAQRSDLVAGLTSPNYLFAHGTLNHAIMQASSWYLLAQAFPDAAWTDHDGTPHDSDALMAALRDLLESRAAGVFREGHNEILSTTYAMIDVFPLLNLVDFAADPEVAARAGAEASLEVLLLKAHSYHGNVLPPLTRRNIDQHNGAWAGPTGTFPSVTQHLLWYYFGEPAFGSHDFIQDTREPYYAVMFALSPWRPPLAAWWMRSEDYVVRHVTPDMSHWGEPAPTLIHGDTYVGRHYALSTGNISFDPAAYADHNQTFALTFRSASLHDKIECQHPYWRSDHGEDAWTSDFWSPFVQTHRLDEQRAVLIAEIPTADPWVYGPENDFFGDRDGHRDGLIQMVQCRIPHEVDQTLFEDHWVFVRHGATSIALGSLAGSMEPAGDLPAELAARFAVVKIREARTALFVMVEETEGSFADFRERARAAAPAYDAATSTVSSVDAMGRPVTVRLRLQDDPASDARKLALPEVRVSGVVEAYADTPVFHTPFMRLADGVLRVEGPGAFELQP